MSQEGYARKWICLFCNKYYDTENEAKKCSINHEEIIMEPLWVIGKEFPHRIVVTKYPNKKQKIYAPIGE